MGRCLTGPKVLFRLKCLTHTLLPSIQQTWVHFILGTKEKDDVWGRDQEYLGTEENKRVLSILFWGPRREVIFRVVQKKSWTKEKEKRLWGSKAATLQDLSIHCFNLYEVGGLGGCSFISVFALRFFISPPHVFTDPSVIKGNVK